MSIEVIHSSLLILHSRWIPRFARNDKRDAETNKMQNKTATSSALICQHDLDSSVR